MSDSIGLDSLLALRGVISATNEPLAAPGKEPMPPDVMAWFGSVLVTLVEQWNASVYSVTDSELRSVVPHDIDAAKWRKAIGALRDHSEHFPRLLLSYVHPGVYLINQAGLQELWTQEFAQSIQLLFGGQLSLRDPGGQQEIEWCEWLRQLNKRLDSESRSSAGGSQQRTRKWWQFWR